MICLIIIGSERDAKNKDLLLSYGITHVINVTTNVHNFFESSMDTQLNLVYYRLPAIDCHKQNLSQYFESVCEFIGMYLLNIFMIFYILFYSFRMCTQIKWQSLCTLLGWCVTFTHHSHGLPSLQKLYHVECFRYIVICTATSSHC
jgi:hypothetical protein